MKKLMACFLTLSLPLLSANYKIGSDTGTDNWQGTSGGLLFPDLDVSGSATPPPFAKNSDGDGVLTLQPNDTLGLFKQVKVNGNIEISFQGSPVDITDDGVVINGHEELCYVDVGSSSEVTEWNNQAGPVTVQAYKGENATNSFAQLVFNAGQNRSIFVTVNEDLTFKGMNDSTADAQTDDGMPLYVSFRGKGTTVFALQSGKQVVFTRETEGVAGDAGVKTHGTHVRILMDQSSLEAEKEKRSQVLFRRAFYTDEKDDEHCWIRFGQQSSFVFLSDNIQGVHEKWVDLDGDNEIDDGEPTIHASYGSIAFDVSNKGSGRMILELARGMQENDYHDAGFNVYGAYVKPTTLATNTTQAVIKNDDLRDTDSNGNGSVYYNQRAGIKAIMRIIDSLSFSYRFGSNGDFDRASQWIARPESDRRGLMVVTHNNSVAKFANNFDQSQRVDLNRWAQSNSWQPGFVLGVNGEMILRPQTFLDYVAANTNKALTGIHTPHASNRVKKHNPAALLVDGLSDYPGRSLKGLDSRGLAISDILYAGIRQEFGINAKIILQGNAGLMVRAAAPVTDGALVSPQLYRPKQDALSYLSPTPGDANQVMAFGMGAGYYDGEFVSILDDVGAFTMQSEEYEGSHALDIEGRLTIESVAGPAMIEDGAVIAGKEASGFLKVPSLLIGYDGRERALNLEDALNDIVITQRPLSMDHLYSVYDVSSILINDDLTLSDVRWIHDDVTRQHASHDVLPHPGVQARPHVVGGELASLRGDMYPPVIFLYNSTISCHESLVATGVRFAVTQYPTLSHESAQLAHNTSAIEMFHRGLPYDHNGFGRVFQLGSKGNVMADGVTTQTLLSDGFLNIYRSKSTSGATAADPTTIKLQIKTLYEPMVRIGQRSFHKFFLANGSQVALGWATTMADKDYAPWNLDESVLTSLTLSDPTNKYGFRFNPYETGVGTLEFAGTPLYIGAGDSDNDAPDAPIPGIDVDGVVYVNHGGKLSVTDTNDIFIDTVIARRVAHESAQAGILALPKDQAHFLAPHGVIQNYDVDFIAGNVPFFLQNGVVIVHTPSAVSDEDSFGVVK